MFLTIVFLLTNLPIILFLNCVNRREFRRKGSKKYTLMVGITNEMQADPEFLKMRNAYEKSLKGVFYFTLPLLFFGALLLNSALTGYVSSVAVTILFPMFFYIYFMHRMMFRFRRRLLVLKEKYVDETTRYSGHSDEEHCYIEDGFWGFQYKNPDNPSTLINTPGGLGQVLNIGTKKGRIFYYGFKWILYITIIVVLSITLFEDMVFPKMDASEEGIRICRTLYPYNIDAKDIEQIEWTEEDFKSGSLSKRTGTATQRILRGDFHLQGVGMVKVYALKGEYVPKIIVRLKDGEIKRVYFSGENEGETRRIFEELKSIFPHAFLKEKLSVS